MRAIVRDTYGPADILELRDIATPEIADDEVLVRVHAAGVDRGVWHVMTGLPYPIRLAGYGLRAPKNPVPGADVAGVVEAVGTAVTRFQPGDEVFGIAKGSYAEYARAPVDKLAAKPANLTFEQAAAVAISGLPALQGLRDHGKLRPGQKVLIIGASGGVGTYAVQLAKAFGAEVTGVCSTTKVDMVRSIGAHHVIDYTHHDFAEGDQRYDLVLDIGGNSSLSRLRRARQQDNNHRDDHVVSFPCGRCIADALPHARAGRTAHNRSVSLDRHYQGSRQAPAGTPARLSSDRRHPAIRRCRARSIAGGREAAARRARWAVASRRCALGCT